MKLFLILLLLLIFVSVAAGEYTFEISTELGLDGKCINWRDITPSISFVLTIPGNPESGKEVFADHSDVMPVTTNDLQQWYVDNEDSMGFYLISFSFREEGLVTGPGRYSVYWLRYSRNGLFSEAVGVAVMKPGKPTKK